MEHTLSSCDFRNRQRVEWRYGEGDDSSNCTDPLPSDDSIKCDHVAWHSGESRSEATVEHEHPWAICWLESEETMPAYLGRKATVFHISQNSVSSSVQAMASHSLFCCSSIPSCLFLSHFHFPLRCRVRSKRTHPSTVAQICDGIFHILHPRMRGGWVHPLNVLRDFAIIDPNLCLFGETTCPAGSSAARRGGSCYWNFVRSRDVCVVVVRRGIFSI